MNQSLFTFAICLVTCFTAMANQGQPRQRKKDKNEVTVQGCMGRMSGDYLLFQADPGNSYVLEVKGKIKLENYLGRQVEVKGREWPTLGTSTNFTRRRAGSPVTIVVEAINTIAPECSDN